MVFPGYALNEDGGVTGTCVSQVTISLYALIHREN